MNATPITVSVDLLDQHEVAVFAQLLQVLVQHRETQAQLAQGPIAQGPASAWPRQGQTDAPAANAATRDAAYAEAASDPEYVAEQVAIAEGKSPVVADISPDSVERQFRAYAAAHGAGAARKLLDKYNAPYLKDVPAEKLSAFVAELV